MFQLPDRNESKAIHRPSELHRGLPPSNPVVTFIGCVPSLADTHISPSPERADKNAIRPPSGEYCAWISANVEAMSRTGARWPSLDSFPASAGTLQMFVSTVKRWYSSRVPSRATEGRLALTAPSSER